jgi:AcrR family transcriptional regulator
MFIEHGYAATTTRAITDVVGISQAALYYHFASKDEILAELLMGIVRYPVQVGATLVDSRSVPAAVRLAALVRCDVHELSSAEHNIGSLFLLPEVRRDHFRPFRAERDRLRGFYRDLIGACLDGDGLFSLPGSEGPTDERARSHLVDLVFGLVESVISIREDRPLADREPLETLIPASALRILGYDGRTVARILDEAVATYATSPTVFSTVAEPGAIDPSARNT